MIAFAIGRSALLLPPKRGERERAFVHGNAEPFDRLFAAGAITLFPLSLQVIVGAVTHAPTRTIAIPARGR
jgi:hypothetical protein